MSIWHKKDLQLSDILPYGEGTMAEHIGIEFTEVSDKYLRARMPVDHRTNQPYGILHGGASCTLAETVGTIASTLVVDRSKYLCVGLEINANHIKSVTEGFVIATATPLHLGKSTHVWDIKIYNEKEKLICVSRLTVAILEKKSNAVL